MYNRVLGKFGSSEKVAKHETFSLRLVKLFSIRLMWLFSIRLIWLPKDSLLLLVLKDNW